MKRNKCKSKKLKLETSSEIMDALIEIEVQEASLKRALKVLEETRKSIITKTSLFTLYDVQRRIRNEIEKQVAESNDDFLKSVFSDVLDGREQTPVRRP